MRSTMMMTVLGGLLAAGGITYGQSAGSDGTGAGAATTPGKGTGSSGAGDASQSTTGPNAVGGFDNAAPAAKPAPRKKHRKKTAPEK